MSFLSRVRDNDDWWEYDDRSCSPAGLHGSDYDIDIYENTIDNGDIKKSVILGLNKIEEIEKSVIEMTDKKMASNVLEQLEQLKEISNKLIERLE